MIGTRNLVKIPYLSAAEGSLESDRGPDEERRIKSALTRIPTVVSDQIWTEGLCLYLT